jgi:hypothetical protein
MNKLHLPDFKTSDERTEYIKNNADYFSITWRKDRKNVKLEYNTLETARHAASLFHKSKFVVVPILIYAVLGPYDSWVENVSPQ